MTDVSRLVVVRHGETDWTRSGRHTSRTDIDLTPAGREAATRLGAALHAWTFAQVLTSPRRRALETARLAGFVDVAAIVDDLVEWDYGEYEGRTTAEIRAGHPGWTVWDGPVPGGEDALAVGARADRVIARVRAVPGDSLVFGHGHLLRVLAARWTGAAPEFGRHVCLDPGAIGMLGWERETPAIEQWNVDSTRRGAEVAAPPPTTRLPTR